MSVEGLLDSDQLGRHLAEVTGDSRWRELSAVLITGGKSNLTFELQSPAGALILRRPPSGKLLPTAHDMAREARVQRALVQTVVPVPEIVTADSGEVLGVPFYVMAKVDGHVVRDELPPGFAATAAERAALSYALIDVLVDLHDIDPQSVGLGDFGRPEGFMERQVRRWRKQWDASRGSEVATVDALANILERQVPAKSSVSIVHGDYRLDNCVVNPTDPARVEAVLDWEMSTLGDPLSDLGLLLFYWRNSGESSIGIVPTVTNQAGFATRADLIEHYSQRSGRDLGELRFYEAFAHFKFAVILQGIDARVKAGSMGGQDFGDLQAQIADIASTGLELATRSV